MIAFILQILWALISGYIYYSLSTVIPATEGGFVTWLIMISCSLIVYYLAEVSGREKKPNQSFVARLTLLFSSVVILCKGQHSTDPDISTKRKSDIESICIINILSMIIVLMPDLIWPAHSQMQLKKFRKLM